MKTTRYVLFTALGLAAVLFLTSDKAKDMRDGLTDNAKKLKNRLRKMGSGTADTLAELKEMLSSEIEGPSDDARRRIEAIIDGSSKTAGKISKNVSQQMS